MDLIIVLAWLACGFVCANIADQKGRNQTIWFFVGVFLGIFGVILISVI